jgi:hypothetical protein
MEDVDAVIAEVQATIKTKLLGYPARVVPFIIGKEDPDEMIRILTKHLYEALSELKGADSEAIKARDKRKQVYFGTKEKMMKK